MASLPNWGVVLIRYLNNLTVNLDVLPAKRIRQFNTNAATMKLRWNNK